MRITFCVLSDPSKQTYLHVDCMPPAQRLSTSRKNTPVQKAVLTPIFKN